MQGPAGRLRDSLDEEKRQPPALGDVVTVIIVNYITNLLL